MHSNPKHSNTISWQRSHLLLRGWLGWIPSNANQRSKLDVSKLTKRSLDVWCGWDACLMVAGRDAHFASMSILHFSHLYSLPFVIKPQISHQHRLLKKIWVIHRHRFHFCITIDANDYWRNAAPEFESCYSLNSCSLILFILFIILISHNYITFENILLKS